MTQAHGESVVRDAQELRVKESDRIAAIASELGRMGADIQITADGFRLEGPTRLQGAQVGCHGDHRLGMALVVAAMLAEGDTHIEGIEVIEESFPAYLQAWSSLGIEL
jgi:3-phosphoshikimate 1-carboxyvinyltransferase